MATELHKKVQYLEKNKQSLNPTDEQIIVLSYFLNQVYTEDRR